VADYPSYDLAKSKELVQQIGGLSFTLTTQDSTERQQLGQLIQSQLSAAGINVEVKPVDATKAIGDLFSKNYEAYTFFPPGHPDPDNWVRPLVSGNPATDLSGEDDPQLVALLKQAQASNDQAERKQIYAQVSAHMAQTVPLVFISDHPFVVIMSPSVQGLPQLQFDDYYLDQVWLKP
jgi:peptide/nickel transport system substrate-binding protein